MLSPTTILFLLQVGVSVLPVKVPYLQTLIVTTSIYLTTSQQDPTFYDGLWAGFITAHVTWFVWNRLTACIQQGMVFRVEWDDEELLD